MDGPDSAKTHHRRALLQAVGVAGVGLAGCLSGGEDESTDEPTASSTSSSQTDTMTNSNTNADVERGIVIDGHAHIWTTEDDIAWKNDIYPAGAVTQLVYNKDDLEVEMEKVGASKAVLVSVPAHGKGSPYIQRVVENEPDRFYGIIDLDPSADNAARRVEETIGSQESLIGVRLGGGTFSNNIDPFLDAMAEHDGQIQILTKPDAYPDIETAIANNPEITFVIDHMGLRDVDLFAPEEEPYSVIEDIASHDNAYLKLTSTSSNERFPHHDLREPAEYLINQFGVDRVVWGSDYIYRFRSVTPWQTIEFLDELEFLSEADKRKIRGENMARLLP